MRPSDVIGAAKAVVLFPFVIALRLAVFPVAFLVGYAAQTAIDAFSSGRDF